MPNIKPTKLTNKQFNEFKLEINAIVNRYKQEFSQQIPTNWQTYEKTWKNRLQTALQQIQKVIDHAAATIEIAGKPLGRPPNTSHKQKTFIILTKDLTQFSGRKMADMLPIFNALNDIELCYKTIQRSYSNPVVKMIIHNMFIILVQRKGITQPDLTGDGTGYSLTITRHYRTVREKQGERAKSNEAKEKPASKVSKTDKPQTKQEKRKLFTYAFALMDIKTHMYVGYGASLKSERAAFNAAMALMHECDVEPKSVRLDQYYAGQSTAELFGAQTSLYVIPKSNATIRGCYAWKDMIRDFMFYPFLFLKEYFKREHSESGFSQINGLTVGRSGSAEMTGYRPQPCAKVFGTTLSGWEVNDRLMSQSRAINKPKHK